MVRMIFEAAKYHGKIVALASIATTVSLDPDIDQLLDDAVVSLELAHSGAGPDRTTHLQSP